MKNVHLKSIQKAQVLQKMLQCTWRQSGCVSIYCSTGGEMKSEEKNCKHRTSQ